MFIYSTIFLHIDSFIPGNKHNNDIYTNNKNFDTNSTFEFENSDRPFYLPLLSYIEKDNEVFLWKEFNKNIPVSIEYNM